MCTVVHDVYIVLYPTIYTVCLCVSVYSAIFILRAPSLRAKFLIVCMLVYTVIKLANVWNELLHREYRAEQPRRVWKCFFPLSFSLFVCPERWRENSFLYTYMWHSGHSHSMHFLSAFRQTTHSYTRRKPKLFKSFTWPISYFQSQTMKKFISLLRVTPMGIRLLLQTNPKVYSSNDALQKKIHSYVCIYAKQNLDLDWN